METSTALEDRSSPLPSVLAWQDRIARLQRAQLLFVLFDQVLHMPWPNALVGDLWPQLRDVWGLRLV